MPNLPSNAAASTSVPPNVVIIAFENKPNDIPSSTFPLITALISPAKYMWHGDYFALSHNSAPNYGAMAFADYTLTPIDGTPYDLPNPSLYGQLTNANIHWEVYYEGLTTANWRTDTDSYCIKHNPVGFCHPFNQIVGGQFYSNANGSKIMDAGSAGTAFSLSGNPNTFTLSHPFQNMLASMNSAKPSSFYWAGPALANQSHGGVHAAPWAQSTGSASGTPDADAFGAYMIQAIKNTAWYANHGNIILWFDEGAGSTPGVPSQTNLILINEGPAKGKGLFSSSAQLDHYGLMHDLLTVYGVPIIGKAAPQGGSILSLIDTGTGPPPPPPTTITSFSPPSGLVGDAVTLAGSGFTGTSAVAFNGTAATYTVSNDTQIVTSVPSGATTGKITVTSPNGMALSASAFTVTTQTGGTRDPLKQPFLSNSIWNQPIGGNAVFVAPSPALIVATSKDLNTDQNVVMMRPTDPITQIQHSGAGWTGASRCAGDGTVLASVPIAAAFTVPGTVKGNYAMSALLADGKTYVQGEPFARCTANTPATVSRISSGNVTDTNTGTVLGQVSTSLYDAGTWGTHGGTNLNGLGGTLRIGELVPGGRIPHALAINIDASSNCANTYRWPASKKDGYSYSGSNTKMVPGALMALPPSFNVASTMLSAAGKILATAFQNYGAYIVNDTATSTNNITSEVGPNGAMVDDFAAAWSAYTADFAGGVVSFTIGTTGGTDNWSKDVRAIYAALRVVDNNSPTSIGGGGTVNPALVAAPLTGQGGGPGTPTQLAFGQQPTHAVAGATITPPVTVNILDANGVQTTATSNVTIAIGTNPASGTLSGPPALTVTAVNGTATFSNLSINNAGTGYTLVASSPAAGLTSATSVAFNITATVTAATQLLIQQGPISGTPPSTTLSPPLTVKLADASGVQTSSTANVTVAFGTNPGSAGTLNGTLTVAAVSGLATFSTLSIDTPATGYTLTFTSSGLTSATTPAFNITQTVQTGGKPVRVQGIGNTNNGKAAALTLATSLPATKAGNFIAVVIGTTPSSGSSPAVFSVTDNAANTYIAFPAVASGTAVAGAIFYCVNAKSTTSVTAHNTGYSGTIDMFVSEWSGIGTANHTDGSASTAQRIGTVLASGSVTTTNANDLIIAGAVWYSTPSVVGQPTGNFVSEPLLSGQSSGNVQPLHLQPLYQVPNATGTYKYGANISGSGQYNLGMIAAFKAASSLALSATIQGTGGVIGHTGTTTAVNVQINATVAGTGGVGSAGSGTFPVAGTIAGVGTVNGTITSSNSTQTNPYPMPAINVQVAFSSNPLSGSYVWTDVSKYVRSIKIRRGRQHVLNRFEPGQATIVFNARDGQLDPTNPTSTYYPNITINKRIRILAGPNGKVIYTGFAESWTPAWPNNLSSDVTMVATDGMRLLAQDYFTSSNYAAQVKADGAQNLLEFNEQQGLATWSGNYAVAADVINTGDHPWLYTPPYQLGQTGISFVGTETGVGLSGGWVSVGSPTPGTEIMSRTDFSFEVWAKWTTTDAYQMIFYQISGTHSGDAFIGVATDANGALNIWGDPYLAGAVGTNQLFSSGPTTQTYNDGNWHHIVLTCTGGQQPYGLFTEYLLYVDGVKLVSLGQTVPIGIQAGWANGQNYVGWSLINAKGFRPQDASTYEGIPTFLPFRGSLAMAAMYGAGKSLQGTTVVQHYQLGQTGFYSEDTGARIGHVLTDVGWPVTDENIATGASQVANPTASLNTTTVLSYMQQVETAERGSLFCDMTGRITFQNRYALTGAASLATFGDASGEIPYKPGPTFGLDNIDLYNSSHVSRSGGSIQTYQDNSSIAQYGMSNVLNESGLLITTDTEALNRAQWNVQHFAQPVARIQSLTVDITADIPNRFTQVAFRELRDMVTVKRRPYATPAGWPASQFSQLTYIEGIEHSIEPSKWEVTLHLSPADTNLYFQLNSGTTNKLDGTNKIGY